MFGSWKLNKSPSSLVDSETLGFSWHVCELFAGYYCCLGFVDATLQLGANPFHLGQVRLAFLFDRFHNIITPQRAESTG